MSTVTICPASPAHFVLEAEPQFAKNSLPVAAIFDMHGEARSRTGLSFDDYQRSMQTVSRRTRCAVIPNFMHDSDKLQEVITVCVELRAQIFVPPQGLTRQQRLDRAQAMLSSRRPNLIRQIENMCARYVAARSAGEPSRELEARITALDRQLQTLERTPQIVCSVLYLSYRVGLNSPQVAALLKDIVSPPGVRQILHRAVVIGKRLESGDPHTKNVGKRGKKLPPQAERLEAQNHRDSSLLVRKTCKKLV